MGELLVKNKDVVVPGEAIAKGMDFIPGQGTYRNDDQILANRLGVVSIDGKSTRIIPLTGQYNPKTGDIIIGKVIDISLNGWRIETNSAYSAMLSMKDATSSYIARGADLTRYYTFGDFLVAKIVQVTSQKLVDLTMNGPGLVKLKEGRIIKVNPNKVPRIIGKQGSMVTMIKNSTACKIVVGQNGVVWISGEPEKELIVVNTLRKIEQEAHISGLTERIKIHLEQNAGSTKSAPSQG